MKFRIHCSLLALWLLGASPVGAQVIDDFEQGSFNLSTTTSTNGTQSFLLPIHCITDERKVDLFSNGGICSSDLNLGNPDDEVATVWGSGGGRLEFDYDLHGVAVDLTYGGVANSLRVFMPVAVPEGRLEVVLTDALNTPSISVHQITGPGDYVFPYSSFGLVDVTQITFIELNLYMGTVGDHHIADFRVWESQSSAAGYDVVVGQVTGPPFPTGNLQILMTAPDQTTGGTFETEMISMQLSGASGPGATTDLRITAAAPPYANGASCGTAEIEFVEVAGGGPEGAPKLPHFVTWDHVYYDFQGRGDFSSHLAAPPEPVLDPSGKWARIMATTYLRDQSGNTVFRTEHTIGIEVPPGSDKVIQAMGIQPTPFEPAAFELILEIWTEGAAKTESNKMDTEMLSMNLNGMGFNYQTATAAPAWTGESLTLWAQPSVMDASTQLWLSRALERETRLRLFDLAGRAVRTLTVPAGREFTVWDGRDARGQRVASGMYMLKALDVPAAGSAKIVKLR